MEPVSKSWPAEGLTRVPYWVYTDPALYAREQERIFQGATWNFLCLEVEVEKPNTWRTSSLGEMPVVIEDDAWVAAGAMVLRGVRVGQGCRTPGLPGVGDARPGE